MTKTLGRWRLMCGLVSDSYLWRTLKKTTLIHVSMSHSMLKSYLPDRKAGSSKFKGFEPRRRQLFTFSPHKWCSQMVATCRTKATGRIPNSQRKTQTQIQEYQCFPMVTNGLIICIGGHRLQCSPRCPWRWKPAFPPSRAFSRTIHRGDILVMPSTQLLEQAYCDQWKAATSTQPCLPLKSFQHRIHDGGSWDVWNCMQICIHETSNTT